MKKIVQMFVLSGSLLLVGSYDCKATIHNVSVTDFQFTPSTFMANTGDTIHWNWVEGSHTTTSTSIPVTAQSWNQPLTSASPTFEYVITLAGNYNYVCTPHASMGMTGNFTAVDPTAIQENVAPTLTFIKNYLYNKQLYLDFSMPSTGTISIELFDMLGHQVYVEKVINQTAGIHSQRIDVGALPNGIYILSLFAQNSRLTHRLVIEN